MRSRSLFSDVHPVLSVFFLNDPPTSVHSTPLEPCKPIATVGSSGCNLFEFFESMPLTIRQSAVKVIDNAVLVTSRLRIEDFVV